MALNECLKYEEKDLGKNFNKLSLAHKNLTYIAIFVLSIQTPSSALQGSIQLGIGYAVGNLTSKPERDVLMQDFYVVESVFLPRLEFIFKTFPPWL